MADALSARFCDPNPDMDAARQDRLLRLSDWLRQQLDQAGAEVALVARAGLDLRPFGLRLSHAGVALRQGLDSPWAVRQLYYACNEGQPRLFDQGLAGFLSGTPAHKPAHFELLLLRPGPQARLLAQAAAETPTALGLLADTYTANAYAWGTRYQNCNQWLAELMGQAWGPTPEGGAAAAPEVAAQTGTQVAQQRARAQAWLQAQGYQPHVFQLGPWRLWLASVWPMVALDDHPPSDRAAHRLLVSMPEPLMRFAAQQAPGSTRWSVCLTVDHAVLRPAGPALDEACTPEAVHADRVLEFQPG